MVSCVIGSGVATGVAAEVSTDGVSSGWSGGWSVAAQPTTVPHVKRKSSVLGASVESDMSIAPRGSRTTSRFHRIQL